MKSPLFGLSLIVVCSASAGEVAADALHEIPAAEVATLEAEQPPAPSMVVPLPPELPAQTISLVPASKKPAVAKIVDPRALIRAAARKHRVPAAFVKSIVAAESNFDCAAISPKGAVGLMQLMPATAQLFGADPTVPEQNVDAGTRYLRLLLDKYHKYRDCMRRVIAAYNAGPGVVDRFHGVPPYPETRVYVARVLAFMKQFQRERG